MLLLLISAAVVMLVVYSLFTRPQDPEQQTEQEVVTRPPCASCKPPVKTPQTEQKGCVGGMCSSRVGCGK